MTATVEPSRHVRSTLVRDLIGHWLRPRAIAVPNPSWTDPAFMTQTSESPVTTQDALKQQFELFYQTARLNLGDITHAQSLVDPVPSGNRANWILGHVIDVQNAIMHLLGEEAVWEGDGLDKITPDPATLGADGLDWGEMKQRLFASETRCLKAVGSMDSERLNEEVDDPFGGTVPRGVLLGILAFHQSYHAGQFGTARRLVGLPGVIKGPGQ